METKYYEIAGLKLCLISEFPTQDTELTRPFLCSPTQEALCCRLYARDSLPPPPGEVCLQEDMMTVYRQGNSIYRSFITRNKGVTQYMLSEITPGKDIEIHALRSELSWCSQMGYIFLAMGLGTLLLGRGRLVLHASVVNTGKGAIVFTAASGTGKSTQAKLWETYAGAETINGDRCCVGLSQGIPTVFGVPMAGTSGISKNLSLPIRALVSLGQAPQNQLRRLRGAEALLDVGFCSVIDRWDSRQHQISMDILSRIMETVPVFSLHCRPDSGAVNVLRDALEEIS